MTEDGDPLAGFYRFVPDVKGELQRGGTLWMLKAEGVADLRTGHQTGDRFKVSWVRIEHPEQGMGTDGHRDGNLQQGLAEGGSRFMRLEGCYVEGDIVYFTSTSGGDAGCGQVWAYDAKASELLLLFQSPAQETPVARAGDLVLPRQPRHVAAWRTGALSGQLPQGSAILVRPDTTRRRLRVCPQ